MSSENIALYEKLRTLFSEDRGRLCEGEGNQGELKEVTVMINVQSSFLVSVHSKRFSFLPFLKACKQSRRFFLNKTQNDGSFVHQHANVTLFLSDKQKRFSSKSINIK